MRYWMTSIMLFFCASLAAQNIHYEFNGAIDGSREVKNAFLYSSEYKLIDKIKVRNGKFKFKGVYHPSDRPGDWPSARLVLTDKDSIDSEDIRLTARTVYYEPNVKVKYNTDASTFLVSGGRENSLENLFLANSLILHLKLDSISKPLDSENITAEVKRQKTRNIRLGLLKEMKLKNLDIIRKNSNSASSMSNFMGYPLTKSISLDEATRIFNSFSEHLRNTGYGRRTAELISKLKVEEKIIYPTPPKLNVGEVMYDFTLPDINGELTKGLSRLGSYTLIDFWASWCIPCRQEAPNLVSAYSMYKEKGFKIIAISIDAEVNKETWKAAVEVDGMAAFLNLFNAGGIYGIAKELNINAIPANYLIDDKGKVIASNLRGSQLMDILKNLYKSDDINNR